MNTTGSRDDRDLGVLMNIIVSRDDKYYPNGGVDPP